MPNTVNTRIVTGLITRSDNIPWSYAQVTFVLGNTALAGLSAGSQRYANADQNGYFQLALWTGSPDDATPYTCRLPSGESFNFNLYGGPSSIDLSILRVGVTNSQGSSPRETLTQVPLLSTHVTALDSNFDAAPLGSVVGKGVNGLVYLPFHKSPVSVGSNKSFGATDADTYQYCTNSSPITLTLLEDTSYSFPLGSEIQVHRAGESVTLNTTGSASLHVYGLGLLTSYVLPGLYSEITLRKVASNTWRLSIPGSASSSGSSGSSTTSSTTTPTTTTSTTAPTTTSTTTQAVTTSTTTAATTSTTTAPATTSTTTVPTTTSTTSAAQSLTVSVSAPAAGVINSPLSLSATATANPGTVSGVQFKVNGLTQGALDTTAPFNVTWTPTTKGTYTITATGVGSLGTNRTSSPVNVPIYDTQLTGGNAGIGCSLGAAGADYILLNNNQSAGGTATTMNVFVGSTQVAAFNFPNTAYLGSPFAYFNSANSTLYTGTIAAGNVTLS